MKASELRIGNFVDVISRRHKIHMPMGIEKQIGEISMDRSILYDINIPVAQQGFSYNAALFDLTPIGLTEKWLIRLGFVKKDVDGKYGYIYFKPHFDYNYIVERDFNEHISHFFGIEYTDCPNEKDNYIIYHFSFDLKYVHQLQNLIFALTQEELTLN